jgi:hypothetical protein
MCRTAQTTYHHCKHVTIKTYSCPFSQSSKTAISGVATVLAFFSSKCKSEAQVELNEKGFCPGCNRIWDALDVPENQRVGRSEAFRARNGWMGPLTPLKMEGEAGVVFRCDEGEVKKPNRDWNKKEKKGLVEKKRGGDEPQQPQPLASVLISPSKRSSHPDRWSLSLGLSTSPVLSTSTASASSTLTVWPSTISDPSDPHSPSFYVERDDFGNPIEKGPPALVWELNNPFLEREFEMRELGGGDEAVEERIGGLKVKREKDRSRANTVRGKENRRSRASTIRGVAPMVAAMVKPLYGAKGAAYEEMRDDDVRVQEREGEMRVKEGDVSDVKFAMRNMGLRMREPRLGCEA